MLKNHIFTILFLGWLVFITIISLFSFPDTEEVTTLPNMDKIAHFTFHFFILILGSLFLWERKGGEVGDLKGIKGLLLFSLLYGLIIEFLQHVLPFDRAAEVWDLLANILGAIAGGLLIKKYGTLITRLK